MINEVDSSGPPQSASSEQRFTEPSRYLNKNIHKRLNCGFSEKSAASFSHICQ